MIDTVRRLVREECRLLEAEFEGAGSLPHAKALAQHDKAKRSACSR